MNITETQNNIANFFTSLSNLLQAANSAFENSYASLSLLPGTYDDGSAAPADITEIEIEPDQIFPSILQVVTHQHGGWVAYLNKLTDSPQYVEAMACTTLEGYCDQSCDCSFCELLRKQKEKRS